MPERIRAALRQFLTDETARPTFAVAAAASEL
jgi:hypothetical protein